MKTLSLRLGAAYGISALFFAMTGCESSHVTPGSSGMFAPQTGSILGRRLPLDAQRRNATVPKRETKAKRQDAKPAPKRERVDDDYMTRGGFR